MDQWWHPIRVQRRRLLSCRKGWSVMEKRGSMKLQVINFESLRLKLGSPWRSQGGKCWWRSQPYCSSFASEGHQCRRRFSSIMGAGKVPSPQRRVSPNIGHQAKIGQYLDLHESPVRAIGKGAWGNYILMAQFME